LLDYVYGHDEIVAGFVAALIPSCRDRGLPKAIRSIGIIDEGGDLIAGLVYHNYHPEAGVIEISAASLPGRQWMTRETIKRMYQYPFHTCGCQMVYMSVSENNELTLGLLARLNHTFHRIPRLLGRDEDGVVCTLTIEEWSQSKFCKRFRHHVIDAQPPMEEAA
jgi:hypothetical protein